MTGPRRTCASLPALAWMRSSVPMAKASEIPWLEPGTAVPVVSLAASSTETRRQRPWPNKCSSGYTRSAPVSSATILRYLFR